MKTFKKAIAVMALAAFSLSVWAGTPSPNAAILFNSKVTDYKAVVVQLANLEKGKTTLTVEDLQGKVFYQDFIKDHNGYRTKLDLSQMPQGRYVIKVKQGDAELKQIVLLNANGLLLSGVSD